MSKHTTLIFNSLVRGPIFALPLLLVLAALCLSGCGSHVHEARAKHERDSQQLAAIDLHARLAGRDAATVLENSLAGTGCVWLVKGLIFPGENRNGITHAAYDGATNNLQFTHFYEYDWSPLTVRRITSIVVVPLSSLKASLTPPSDLDSSKCWTLQLACPEDSCMQVDQLIQHISGGTTTDKERDSSNKKYFSVDISHREKAIDAWAAVRELAGQ